VDLLIGYENFILAEYISNGMPRPFASKEFSLEGVLPQGREVQMYQLPGTRILLYNSQSCWWARI